MADAPPPKLPQTPPPTLPPQAIDITAPPVPKPISLEDDPNHLISQMIARRGQNKTEEPAKPTDKPEDKPSEPPKENKALGDLISKTLGFRSKPVEKVVTPPAPAKIEPATPITPAPADKPTEPADKPKSIVSRRKQKQDAPDALAVATQAASAAATAAVRAVQDRQPQPKVPEIKEDNLTDEDRHDYEVAKYLGTVNPKYLGAEKVVLEHVRKAEAYAARWEQQNPGKVFDKNDTDHNDFYAALEKPWNEHEFRMAENEIAAERVVARKNKGTQGNLEEHAAVIGKMDLKPTVNQTLFNVATELARGLGDSLLEKIQKQGLEKFAESDPTTANVLSEVLAPLHPLIETIIEIDDPKGRIPYDGTNPNHVAWSNLLFEKEQQYVGVKDNGKLFATRAEMHAMSPAERKGRFYLTADHLVAELVADATELAKERIKTKRDEIEKSALAMGFVRPGANSTPVTPSDTTKPAEPATNGAPLPQPKPASPSDGGSPRIDASAGNNNSPSAKALAATAGILFAR